MASGRPGQAGTYRTAHVAGVGRTEITRDGAPYAHLEAEQQLALFAKNCALPAVDEN